MSGIAAMLVCTIVWSVRGTAPLRPAAAQLDLLERFDPAVRPWTVAYTPLRFGDAHDVPERLELPSFEPVRGAAPGVSYFQPWLPAGEYRIVLRGEPPERVDVTVGRGPRPIASIVPQAIGARTQLLELTLPIGVTSFGLIAAGGFPSPPAMRPIRLFDSSAETRYSLRARSGARYGPMVVFALSESVHLEPAGAWVLAGADSRLAVQPTTAGALQLSIRTGPTANVISVVTRLRTETLNLQPGETREVRIESQPADQLVMLTIRAQNGFRPKDVDPAATDDRLLGCWLTFE
jgi:hypothetical protein